jgi:hypothetical protein
LVVFHGNPLFNDNEACKNKIIKSIDHAVLVHDLLTFQNFMQTATKADQWQNHFLFQLYNRAS